MEEHFNDLTPAEAERLAWLIEELAEAQQAACKVLRHGYENFNPHDTSAGTNRQQLMDELGHVFAAIHLMVKAKDMTLLAVDASAKGKVKSVQQWMHHQ